MNHAKKTFSLHRPTVFNQSLVNPVSTKKNTTLLYTNILLNLAYNTLRRTLAQIKLSTHSHPINIFLACLPNPNKILYVLLNLLNDPTNIFSLTPILFLIILRL